MFYHSNNNGNGWTFSNAIQSWRWSQYQTCSLKRKKRSIDKRRKGLIGKTKTNSQESSLMQMIHKLKIWCGGVGHPHPHKSGWQHPTSFLPPPKGRKDIIIILGGGGVKLWCQALGCWIKYRIFFLVFKTLL